MADQGKATGQYYIDAKWDTAIDTTLRRVVYGSLAGGVAALLLFRERWGRQRQDRVPGDMLGHSVRCQGRPAFQALPWAVSAGGPSVRAATVAFGAGTGFGSSYQSNQSLVRVTWKAATCFSSLSDRPPAHW